MKVIGAGDKRQITACIASSLHGDLLPLQLIFQGKTTACHPDRTPAATAARNTRRSQLELEPVRAVKN